MSAAVVRREAAVGSEADSEKQGSDKQTDEEIDGLDAEEIAGGLGEEGEHAVSVLDDGAGDEDAEGQPAGGEEGDEDEVGAGLGDDADEAGGGERRPWVLSDEDVEVDDVLE